MFTIPKFVKIREFIINTNRIKFIEPSVSNETSVDPSRKEYFVRMAGRRYISISNEQYKNLVDVLVGCAPDPEDVPDGDIWNPIGWEYLMPQLGLIGVTKMLASHCELIDFVGDKITLSLPPSQAPMWNKPQEKRLQEALSGYYGRDIKLSVIIEELEGSSIAEQHKASQEKLIEMAVGKISEDTDLTALLEMFKGTLESVEKINR